MLDTQNTHNFSGAFPLILHRFNSKDLLNLEKDFLNVFRRYWITLNKKLYCVSEGFDLYFFFIFDKVL